MGPGSVFEGQHVTALFDQVGGDATFALSDNGILAIEARVNGNGEIITSAGTVVTFPGGNPGAPQIQSFGINSSGLFAYITSGGVYTQYGQALGDGDVVDGKTITGFSVNGGDRPHEIINDSGDIVVGVAFSDGSKGVVLLADTSVPEPGTMALMLAAFLLLAWQHCRRSAQSANLTK